jgi:ribosomal protein S19
MSRSSWKPPYLPAVRRPTIDAKRSIPSIADQSLRPRSVRVVSAIVGRRIRVLRGLRAVPLLISNERIGHAVGEFVPTRKRPRILRSANKVVKKASEKPGARK